MIFKTLYVYCCLCLFALKGAYPHKDRILSYGNPKAPLHILDLVSPSCHVCAEFQKKIFPKLKKHYIDTGKVYLDIQLMAYNYLDLRAASLILASAHPKKMYGFIFKTQQQWILKDDPVKALEGLLKKENMLMNLNEKQRDQYENLLIVESQKLDQTYNVEAIPMLIIGRKKIIGLLPWNDLKKHIDEALSHIKRGRQLSEFGPTYDHKKKSAKKI